MAELPESQKIKVHKINKPDQVMYVTSEAAKLLSTKWVIAENQAGAPSAGSQKKAVAAPAENTIDRKAALREQYNELTGGEAEPEWNEARLFVEIEKAKRKTAPAPVEPEPAPVEPEAPTAEPAKEKRKYTKKVKA